VGRCEHAAGTWPDAPCHRRIDTSPNPLSTPPPSSYPWPTLLARAVCPYEEPIAAAVASHYTAGGRERALVLRGRGESTGAFGGGVAGSEFASLLDAVAASSRALLAFLDAHQGLGTLAGVGSLVIAMIDRRRSRPRETPDGPPGVPSSGAPASPAPETPTGGHGSMPQAPSLTWTTTVPDDTLSVTLSADAVALVDGALDELARHLAVRGLDREAAWARACETTLWFVQHGPAASAGHIRDLTGTDADGRADRRWRPRWPGHR
jgi:hypothetical protein